MTDALESVDASSTLDHLLRHADLLRTAWPEAPENPDELADALHRLPDEEQTQLRVRVNDTLCALVPDAAQRAALVELDGATLEGGGQLLRSAFAYAVLLGRPVRVYNIRAGRSKPGMQYSHCAALGAVARASGSTITGCTLHSRVTMLVPPSTPHVPSAAPTFVVDGNDGESTPREP